MSYAYTPGLKVKDSTIVRKTRVTPIPGEVLVREGEAASYNTVVARTMVPGGVYMNDAAKILDCSPKDLPIVMLKKENQTVEKGELIGLNKIFFGLFTKKFISEVDGTIEMISQITGTVAIREAPVPVEIDAYISGKVVNVIPKLGAVIETPAAFVQGIFGIGGEMQGEIMMIASPADILTADKIGQDCSGKILVGGSLITEEALHKAADVGAKGIVGGGIKRGDVTKFLGYEIGVAITGKENIPLTCIITEGFGKMNMAKHTFDLLSSQEGKVASINGATQIRAGVIRPEIIIPLEKSNASTINEGDELAEGMVPGTLVRIIRQPYFGALGHILSLPVESQRAETESKVRVAIVELEDGNQVIVPRANVELMEQ